MADGSGWEELPKSFQDLIKKGAIAFKRVDSLKQRSLLVTAVIEAWKFWPDAPSFRHSLEEMSDAGLNKASLILDELAAMVHDVRAKRCSDRKAKP